MKALSAACSGTCSITIDYFWSRAELLAAMQLDALHRWFYSSSLECAALAEVVPAFCHHRVTLALLPRLPAKAAAAAAAAAKVEAGQRAKAVTRAKAQHANH
jgi:hypothetical protein